MSLKWRLVLFAAVLFELVKSQGFGGYEDLSNTQVYEAGGNKGKKSPLEKQDRRISPQQSLKQRMGSTKSVPFSEVFPTGWVRFGDTIMSNVQRQRLFSSWGTQSIKNFDRRMIWKDAVIPYSIDCSLEKLKDAVSSIKAAMKEWERKTCIQFVKRKEESKYVRFFRDTNCWVHVDMNTQSSISVGYGCEKSHIMAHYIGHVIGLYHQHNRKDRDNYVKIRKDKAIKGYQGAFSKVRNSYPSQLSYDYNSIMHYPWTAFSKDGSKTIRQLSSSSVGKPYERISVRDVQQTKSMYNCQAIKRKRNQIAAQVRSQTRARIQSRMLVPPPDNDEYQVFSAMRSSPGDAGCVDWANVDDCKSWKRLGYCQTQETVRQYCKKTCDAIICAGPSSPEGLSFCEGEDTDPKCPTFGKFCSHPNYKDWMKENCCNFCVNREKSVKRTQYTTCVDSAGASFCTKYSSSRGYCRNSKNFREKLCCKTCKDRNVCRSNPNICGQGRCKSLGGFRYKCVCNAGTVAVDGGKRCVVDRCGGCDTKNGKCVKTGDNYGCQCKEGYLLQNDKKTCSDRDECRSNRDICELGKCINLQGSFRCTCNAGATGVDGGKRCIKKTTCKVIPSLSVVPMNPEYPGNLGTGRLCRNMKDRNADNCDEDGLEPKGLCTKPLGLSHRYKIPDTAFTSSLGHLVVEGGGKRWAARPANARLYFEDNYRNSQIGAWCAATGESTMNKLQYLRVDLGKTKRITHISTQGRDKYFERVSQFKIEYSDTGNDDDFCPYLENGKEKIFDGNCDHVTPVVNQFFEPLIARFVRYIPWKYNYPCVRMEFYGCDNDELQPDP